MSNENRLKYIMSSMTGAYLVSRLDKNGDVTTQLITRGAKYYYQLSNLHIVYNLIFSIPCSLINTRICFKSGNVLIIQKGYKTLRKLVFQSQNKVLV